MGQAHSAPEANTSFHPRRDISSREEVKAKGKKASGPDGFYPEIIKAVLEDHPEKCLTAMTNVVQTGIFPKEWKIGRLVLLKKEKKVSKEHPGYRLLSILNILGKILEQLVLIRLKEKLERRGSSIGSYLY
ncbi:hypothetical protein QE152_g13731 [Popillia japonica]|uniref:Reverse transcriptase domain-containing protein n=1 Tax=Popillia japonica TaxID=7064 RepID=A0AAW1LBM4_POPJA